MVCPPNHAARTGSGTGDLIIEGQRRPGIGRLTLLILGLYAAQAVTGSMVQTALPAVFRSEGMDLARIGFLSVLFLPWVFKVFWAPVVDRIGQERRWILACQAGLIIAFLGAAAFPPQTAFGVLVAVLLVMTLVAATQDIATDALAVRATHSDTRALAGGAATIGGYAGFLAGGGVWLWVYAAWGWGAAMVSMAIALAVLSLPTLLVRDLPVGTGSARPRVSAIVANRALMRGMGVLIVWQLGVRLGLSLASPMLIDAGLSLELVGWVRGTGGVIAGLLGAVAGTWIARQFGLRSAFVLAGGLVLVFSAGLVLHLLGNGGRSSLVALLLALSFATALSFVALYSSMMEWCGTDQIATDFALLQSLDAAIAVICGIAGGLLAEAFGYGVLYGVAILSMAIALPLMLRHVLAPTQPPFDGLPETETPR